MRQYLVFVAVLCLNAPTLGQSPKLEKWKTADGKEVEAVFQSFDVDSGKLTLLIPKTIDVQLLDDKSQAKAKQYASPGGVDWESAGENVEPYSSAQIMRLFEVTWQCNHQLTLQCPWNATIEQEQLETASHMYAIDFKQTAFFKNDGIMFSYGRKPASLFELPYKQAEKFSERVRILSPEGFAFRLDTGIWLVFVPISD